MISLSYKQIRNANFSAALIKLGNHSGFNGKQAYHIGRIVDKALSFEKQCVQEENKIHIKYAKKNEDGTIFTPEGRKPGYYEIPEENVENHNAEVDELMKESVQIDKNKIRLSDLDHTGLTPAQMVAIEPLIETEEDNVLTMVKKPTDESQPTV